MTTHHLLERFPKFGKRVCLNIESLTDEEISTKRYLPKRAWRLLEEGDVLIGYGTVFNIDREKKVVMVR